MPDRTCWYHFFTLGGMAAFISLGKILASGQRLRVSVIVGRMICSFGLGCSAAFLGFFTPGVPLYVQIGLSCALATLGTDVFTSIITKRFGEPHE